MMVVTAADMTINTTVVFYRSSKNCNAFIQQTLQGALTMWVMNMVLNTGNRHNLGPQTASNKMG